MSSESRRASFAPSFETYRAAENDGKHKFYNKRCEACASQTIEPFHKMLSFNQYNNQNYQTNRHFLKIRFIGGFAADKTPLRRAMRARAPRGADKILDFVKRRSRAKVE
jgi:hypothetical protein